MSLTRYAEKLPLVQKHPARWLKIDAALVQGCASCSWRLPVPHSDGTTHTNGGRHPSKPHIANSWNKSSSGERVGPSHAEKKLGAARGMVGKHGMGEVMGAAPPNGRRGVEEVVERDTIKELDLWTNKRALPTSAKTSMTTPDGKWNTYAHTSSCVGA